MFRLLTLFVSMLGFAAVVWFGVTVELGDRTLFGHLRAIGQSDEAQQLWDGTRSKVTDFVGIEAAQRAEAAKERLKEAASGDSPVPATKGPATKGPALERPAPARNAAEGKQAFARASGKPPSSGAGTSASDSK